MPTTNKAILKKIATFTTNLTKLRNEGHTIAMMIYRHAAPGDVGPDCSGTGDCSTMKDLVKAMPSSWQEQMLAWLKANSPIRVNISGDNVGFDPKYKAEKDHAKRLTWWKLEEANTVPFFDLTTERAAKEPMDFAAMVKMVQGLQKRIAKAVEDGNVKPEDTASALAIAAEIGKLEFKKIVNPEEKLGADLPLTSETVVTLDTPKLVANG
jgi:hypothetical protein